MQRYISPFYQDVDVERRLGFIRSNESNANASMLAAAHQNATECQLFTGDRANVDTLLNKQMSIIPNTVVSRLVAVWLRLAHYIQLFSMTFMAAQKGWDGVFLVVLLLVNSTVQVYPFRRNFAKSWPDREGMVIRAKAFQFSGRMMMLGAIQVYSHNSVTLWMDGIVPPHPRREEWLELLQGKKLDRELDAAEVERIRLAASLAIESASIMRSTLTREDV
ncbi:hypothetical protein PISL3812_01342 [Talaromyces islandicus]|uniref:Uncharacterized protein n=1 Tax=Talaromyces islandicus TaxID=28573 RepID=A0A0U1LNL8_TALIS|nr:hypothetical protein PISL3812_01342 [Talaromyces islandicus]